MKTEFGKKYENVRIGSAHWFGPLRRTEYEDEPKAFSAGCPERIDETADFMHAFKFVKGLAETRGHHETLFQIREKTERTGKRLRKST